jgi:ribosomal protein S18 acetylase RimI-like enzyme
MNLGVTFRQAHKDDARSIAELIAVSSDGVALIEWNEEAEKHAGASALDIGTQMYTEEHGDYSYRNAVIAETEGQVIGMLLSFPMEEHQGEPPIAPPFDGSDVFAPYKYLEEPNSWYICGVALFPEYRGQGIGSKLLDIAREQAREHSFSKLSLVAFEQNVGSVRLYKRHGYYIADRAPIVAHPLIHYTSDALLMVASVS